MRDSQDLPGVRTSDDPDGRNPEPVVFDLDSLIEAKREGGWQQKAHDPFDPATAHRLYKFIYSSGGTRDFAQAYRAFRGRDPHVEALLEGRGLLAPAA